MIEIEQKFRGVDLESLRAQLREWGVEQWEQREEADHYLNAPDRDFAQTNEAFRLRRVGENNYLTFKGPRTDTEVKIRPELEVAVAPGGQSAEDLLKLFQMLGYRPVAVVKKHREQASFQRDGYQITACLDHVEHVGKFAELEIVAPEPETANARAVLLQVCGELGLTNVEQRSYLSLFLSQASS